MRCIVLLVGLALLSACSGGTTPVPYLVNSTFKTLDSCRLDFKMEEGDCFVLENGELTDTCQRVETECKEHVYISKRRGVPYIIHVNVQYPCYSQWVLDAYNDPDSPYYHDTNYNVVSFYLLSSVTDDIVHLIEANMQTDLQTGETCYYRLETGISDLETGEYGLKVWNPEHSMIFQTTFEK